jgi:gliding motility-associated-like protein
VGTPISYTITVNPTPVVNAITNITVCNGASVPASAFASTPAGATFTWTNSNTAIGLAASGTGNTPVFTATNTSGSPVTATVAVTPTLSGCVGTPISYTITVNPTPVVNAITNITVCNGASVPASAFASTPAGATFTWTNSNTAIGLAASGTGNTPVFTATNTSGSPVTATVAVTPTLSGCVGTPVTYTITVNPTPAAPTVANVTICPNNSATLTATAPGGNYEWFDALVGGNLLGTGASYSTPVLTTSTSYFVQTSINGCVSPRTTVTVTIAPALTVNAGLDATICNGDSYTLGVTPNGLGFSYSWSELPANPNFSSIFNPTVSPTITTTYVVAVTDANNCFGSDTVTITVNPTPVVNAITNITVCNGASVPASAFASTPAGATFTWTNSNTAIGLAASGSGNTPAFTATNTSGSPVTATVAVTPTLSGCVGTPVTYTITVNPTPTVTVPANITVCGGNNVPASAFASVPASATFTWTNSNTAIGLAASGSGNTPAFTATNTSGSPITATVAVTPTLNGCVGVPVSYTITVNAGAITTVPTNITVCPGATIPASAFTSTPAGATFTWTNSNTAIGLAASGTGNTPAFTATNTSGSPVISTITVVGTSSGCVGPPASYTITVNPIVSSTSSISICQGDSFLVGGVYYSATGSYSETLTSSFGCDSIATINLTLNPVVSSSVNLAVCSGDSMLIQGNYYADAGSYSFNFTSSLGCDSIVTYNLSVNPLPTISILGGGLINLGESVNLTVIPISASFSYFWSPSSGLSCVSCAQPIASPSESTWYFVSVTDANGCQATDSVFVEVDPSSSLYIPNIFSPNDDGNNDIYLVRGKGVSQFLLQIYNRWGQLVFESNDIENGWDGTKDGNPFNQGVFVYKITATMSSGKKINETGNITLLR